MLPGLSGEVVLPRLRGIPVIVVSAKVSVQDKVELLLGGAADLSYKTVRYKGASCPCCRQAARKLRVAARCGVYLRRSDIGYRVA